MGRVVAFLLPRALAAVVGVWMLMAIPAEPLLHTDEIRAAERARGFLLTGDPWTVTEGGEPVFAKPPLQYWLSAPMIAWLGPCEAAVRLWPAVFALGGILAAGWLAGVLWPEHRWAPGLAAALVACNAGYLAHGISGLLDAGQALGFTLLAVAVAKTLSSPKWWLVGGGLAGLLALQKSPAGVGFWLACGLAMWASQRGNRPTLTPWVWGGLCLAVLPVVGWPVLQVMRHGTFALDVTLGQQIVNRFTQPAEGDAEQGLREFAMGYLASWKVCGLLVLAALAFVAARQPRGAHPLLRGLAVVILAYGLVAAFAKPPYPRYLLAVVPVAAAVASGILLSGGRCQRLAGAAIALCIAVSLPWTGVGVERSRFNADDYAAQARMAKHLRTFLRESGSLIVASSPSSLDARIFAYYLDLPRIPLTADYGGLRLDINDAATRPESEPLYIVCEADMAQALAKGNGRVAVLLTDGNFALLAAPPPAKR